MPAALAVSRSACGTPLAAIGLCSSWVLSPTRNRFIRTIFAAICSHTRFNLERKNARKLLRTPPVDSGLIAYPRGAIVGACEVQSHSNVQLDTQWTF